jgi:DNA-binding response OmpR family regulator
MFRVLVVDDDPGIGSLLAEYLGGHGLRVERATDGPQGLARARAGDVDLVVLDLTLPGLDGLEVLRRLRADDADRIVGLELGADDYLPKPFNPRELLARIRSVLRRSAPAGPEDGAPALVGAGIRVDPARREVTVDGAAVDLTTTEFDLLRALVAAAGRVIPRENLMERARGEDYAAFERSVDVHISHLRRKLGDDPKAPRRIKTIRGVGYLVPRDAG